MYRTIVAIKRSLQVVKILLLGQGLFRSMQRGHSFGRDDEPIPWFTYPAIEYLKQFDFSDKRVFEYGAGNSSIFWARRAREVVAVESDRNWHSNMTGIGMPNLVLLLQVEKEKYVASICQQQGKFDVIVIDGKWRNACAAVCFDSLSDQGMIILDNSDRQYKGCKQLRAQGMFQIDFSGFSPINGYASTTSIFIKAPTKLQSNFAPPSPVGGLEQIAGDDD